MKLSSTRFLSFLILATLLSGYFSSEARIISSDEAIERIKKQASIRLKKAGSSTKLKLRDIIRYGDNNFPSVYIFLNESDNGYFISPADDRFPAVLGYSDSPSDTMPPSMKWWLSCYAQEIASAFDSDGKEKIFQSPTHEKWVPIKPLVKTKWNQDHPYNLYSPEVEIDGAEVKCPTGCVATSMAQIMKYHNWPVKGRRSSTYDWTDRNGKRHTFSTDFSEYVFDWDNMLESYDYHTDEDGSTKSDYSYDQAKAVARLMHACGMAEKMNFDPWGSGAQTADIPNSLTEYFNYSHDVRFKIRAFATTAEWEKIIYESLRDYGPVIYNGRDDQGGHSFICDGYDGEGYYHFNWGWGGMSDGYFLFFRLNPTNQGIGSFEGGYNLDQNIIYNIRPAVEGEKCEKQKVVLQAGGNLIGDSQNTAYNICFFTTASIDGNLWTGFANNSSETINANFAVRFIDKNMNQTILKGMEITNLLPGYCYNNLSVEINGLPMGEYIAYAGIILKDSEDFIPIEYPAGCRDYTKVLIGKNGNCMISNDFEEPKGEAVVTSFRYPDTIERGESNDCLFTMANLNENIDYESDTRGIIKDNKGNTLYSFRTYTFIPGGYSLQFPIQITLPFPEGDYYIEFESSTGRKISRTFNFTIKDSANENVPKDISVTNISYASGYEPFLTLKISFFVPSPTEDYYDYYVKIFDEDMNYIDEYMCHPDTRFDWVEPNKISTNSYQMIPSVTDVYNIEAYKRMRFTSDRNPVDGEEVRISKTFRIDLGKYISSPIEEVRLSDVPEILRINSSCQIHADIFPSEFAYDRLFWLSTDEKVITVDDNGLANAIGEGVAKIVVSSGNGKFDYREIKVTGSSASIPDNMLKDDDSVEAVFSIGGIKLLESPSPDDIHNLPKGIYIIKTLKGIRKLAI